MRKALYFLGILNDSDMDWLVTAGTRRRVDEGAILITEGRPIESVYLVIDGAFSVRTAALGAKDLARLMSGEVIGEMSFVDRTLPSATVRALESSCVLDIPRQRLRAKLADDSAFAARFYRAVAMFLSTRLRVANAALAGRPAADNEAEMDFDSLDDISMAGARFDWIQRRLNSAQER